MRGHPWRSLVQNPAAAGLTSELDQISQSLISTSSQSLMDETCPLCHSRKKMALALALCGNHWGSWSIASERKWVKEALTCPHSFFLHLVLPLLVSLSQWLPLAPVGENTFQDSQRNHSFTEDRKGKSAQPPHPMWSLFVPNSVLPSA